MMRFWPCLWIFGIAVLALPDARAQQDGVEGRVLVEFTVQPNGSVGAVRVVSAAPEKIFDDAALAAVKRWRFEPVAAPVTAQRSIRFSPTQ